MNVLAVNCGSSTLKFQLIELRPEGEAPGRLARGIVKRIGGDSALEASAGEERLNVSEPVGSHEQASARVLAWLRSLDLLAVVDAVGHRVVHGGERFDRPSLVDDAVIAGIEEVARLAPLHNRPALAAIRAVRGELGDAVPAVATFDTDFHRSMPERASRYAIAPELADRHGVRRYGFHGLAHRYMSERYEAIAARSADEVTLVTLQLGNGCSATAVRGGCSIDTSMGFTPLEGLVMGTRSGDVDPSLGGFLAQREGVEASEVEDWLNRRSGLLGVSGRSGDMRELLEAAAAGEGRAELAVEMFCYRVRKYVGAYLAALGGADAIVFGGGIGEHAAAVRARVCAGMEWCGLVLDEARNAAAMGSEARISADSARLAAYVIPVDEELVIAREAARVVTGSKRP